MREIEDRLIAFDRLFEELRDHHGHASPALNSRYERLRAWVARDYNSRRTSYEDIARHGALRLGESDPVRTLLSPVSLDGVIGRLEQTIQSQRAARYLVTRAKAELERAEEQERDAVGRGPLGAAVRLPMRLISATAAFVDRHLRIVAGLVVLVIALVVWPDQRLFFVALAVVALLAERIYVAIRPG
jgi:hypothetical protein